MAHENEPDAAMRTTASSGSSGLSVERLSSPGPKMKREFHINTLISVGWNMVNVFGGLSYVFVIGFSAGGIPTILYGFIGTSFCVLCLTAVLAECAATFPTAGGAYHFSTFLAPAEYRRPIGYMLGWLNYLGWLFTIAACCSISTGLTYSLVVLCKLEFAVTARWQLFIVNIAWAIFAWAVNVFWLPGVRFLSNVGCWVSLAAFIGFFITLVTMAPKASPSFIFHDIVDTTGFNSSPMAVTIGLINSISIFVSLDASCHLAEEVPHPAVTIPKVLYFTTFLQIVVGLLWILAVGFSIQDINAIVNTPTGVPIVEVIRLALHSNIAGIALNLALLILYISATCGATISTSRQGMALARDGGLFFKSRLSQIHPTYNLPVNSVHFATLSALIIGLVFLFSSQGFNALLGTASIFMIESYAAPALMMVCFGRKQLQNTPFSMGRLAYPCCVVAIFYGIVSTVLLMFPSTAPVTAGNMNYACLLFGLCFIILAAFWHTSATESYRPPSFDEFLANIAPSDYVHHSNPVPHEADPLLRHVD